jgi:hypothetical protein
MSVKRFTEFINEATKHPKKRSDWEVFAEKRAMGAQKIAENAKEKGGLAMLTYNHFIVKLPYYKKAATYKMGYEDICKEYDKFVKELTKGGFTQTEFQKLMGNIEVLGELKLEYEKLRPESDLVKKLNEGISEEVDEARLRPEELDSLRAVGLLDPDLFDPEEKDIQRAIDLQNKPYSKRDGAAESMAKLITDHQKLVRRAKAIAKQLLLDTDYTQLADVKISNKEAFDMYRKYLRNRYANPMPFIDFINPPEPQWVQE